MPLARGSRLGPYEVLSPLGAGGMGEVHRARDPRLGREVAIKVVATDAETNPERLRRFEGEARAAGALNHPNVLSVFDTGIDCGRPYVVFELLEGETLRERLKHGALPPRKAQECAVQICHGLAAAHAKGIVHRDLKPENLFLTRDGRVKILDFGLAKLTRTGEDLLGFSTQETPTVTRPGALVGTFGYMAPEQARGLLADARSDLFALGTVLYEALSGKAAFLRATPAETISAVLTHDPGDIVGADDAPLPPSLVQIVRRCLEKDPEERFQSARDLGFALANLSGSTSSGASGPSVVRRRAGPFVAAGAAILLVALPAVGYLAGKRLWGRPVISFQRLTFRRGTNWNARFAPDGQTIVYGAAWEGQPIRLFSTRVDSPESRSMDLPDGDLLAISSRGELAISLQRSALAPIGYSLGTLARVPLAGGAPREILENVQAADFSPDGSELAVTRAADGRVRLEFPIGRILVETDRGMLCPRVSPKRDSVAFIESDAERGDEYRGISLVDRAGNKRVLTTGWRWLNTLAWSPGAEEVWFTASQAGPHGSLWAVNRSGRARVLARFPAFALLQDVSSTGQALVTLADIRTGVIGVRPGDLRERDLSWLEFSSAADVSIDGRLVVGTESGEGTKSQRAVYLRRTDGLSPPVRLGDGFALALSPDSKWVLARPQDKTMELILLPTGPGDSRVLSSPGIEYGETASWAVGGKHILVTGRNANRPFRSFVMDLDGRAAAVTPEGVVAAAISPDGQRVAALDAAGRILLYPAAGGDPEAARAAGNGGHRALEQRRSSPLRQRERGSHGPRLATKPHDGPA
jgi:hypothetical protein